jgi:hypothetical protein
MEHLDDPEMDCNSSCEKALQECESRGVDTEECQERWDDCVAECDSFA